jgi:hypothetical protein
MRRAAADDTIRTVRRPLGALLAALAASVALFAGPVTGAAAAELIVFSSARDGNLELYAVRPDGTGLERLTDNAAIDAAPDLSPDGTRVAFASTRDGNSEIYTMRLDGTGLVRLTDHNAIDSDPEWSPDGTRIAFVSSRSGHGDIYSMSATDGSAVVRLTSSGAPDDAPAWSPDGTRLAFASLRSGLGDVYAMRADGAHQRRLTTSLAPDGFPAWSPDGERLAFASLRSGWSDIYTMKPDGTQQRRVTTGSAVESAPDWTPDGARLAVTSAPLGSLDFDLRLIDADGSQPTALAVHPAFDGAPDWGAAGAPPDPVGDGVLLPGEPDALAVDAIFDFDTGSGVPDEEVGIDADGFPVARTQFEIALFEDATVGQLNALLEGIGGRIVSMIEGVPFVIVQVPDPGSVAALDALVTQVELDSAVKFVNKGYFGEPDELPSNITTDAADLALIDHHVAVRAPAAWNARAALTGPTAAKPRLVVADYFGDGASDADTDVTLVDGVFGVGKPDDHGYHVVGIIAATFGGVSTPRGQVTGMFPANLDLGVVDTVIDAGKTLTRAQRQNAVIDRVKNAGFNENVVVNTSLNDCGSGMCGDQSKARRVAATWAKKVQDAGLESEFLHVTSAGNINTPGITDAQTNSAWAAAKLLSGLTVPGRGGPVAVPNLTNTLVVENMMNRAGTATPLCLRENSKAGGDMSGIGTAVHSFTGSAAGAGDLSGTSMSTPQVAGLAAYVWALAPSLTPQQVMNVLSATAFPPLAAVISPGCSFTAAKPLVDAYSAVLSLDAAALPTAANAPIRNAILDQDGDGRFTAIDLGTFLDRYRNPVTGALVAPTAPDYSRYDLNGDGFTGGPTTAGFDLDRVGSAQYGAPQISAAVTQEIEGVSVTFDERAVTDLDVLCYYAYSDLFDPNAAVQRESLLSEFCGIRITILAGIGIGFGDLGVDGTGIGVQEYDDDENVICCAPVVLPTDSPPPVSLALGGTTLAVGRFANTLGIDVTGTGFDTVGTDASSSSNSATRVRLTSPEGFTLDVAVDPAWHQAGEVRVGIVVTETGDDLTCDGRDLEGNGNLTFTCLRGGGVASGPAISLGLPAGTYTIDVEVGIGGGGADSSSGSGRVVTLTLRP